MVVAFSARSRLLVFLHLIFIIHKSRVQTFPDAETVRNEYFVSSDQYLCLTNFVVSFSLCAFQQVFCASDLFVCKGRNIKFKYYY